MNKRHKLNYIALSVSSLVFTASLFADTNPSDFSSLEIKHKCGLIDKGFNEKDVIRRETKEYVVAWCKTVVDEGLIDDRYPERPDYNLLIIYKNKKHDWATCSNYIPVSRMTVLSILGEKKPTIVYDKIPTLEKFWDARNDSTTSMQSLAGTKATSSGLYIGWWDAGQVLYCHDGLWLMGGYH